MLTRSWISTFFSMALLLPANAEPKEYRYPKLNLGELLSITSSLQQKNVIVSSRDDLKRELALVIPTPVDQATALKVIDALLLLEGFELIEEEGELHLSRLLTVDQCQALNRAIGRRAPEKPTDTKTKVRENLPIPGRVIVRPKP